MLLPLTVFSLSTEPVASANIPDRVKVAQLLDVTAKFLKEASLRLQRSKILKATAGSSLNNECRAINLAPPPDFVDPENRRNK